MGYDLFSYDGQNRGGWDFHFLKNGGDENWFIERHHAPFTLVGHAALHGGSLRCPPEEVDGAEREI